MACLSMNQQCAEKRLLWGQRIGCWSESIVEAHEKSELPHMALLAISHNCSLVRDGKHGKKRRTRC